MALTLQLTKLGTWLEKSMILLVAWIHLELVIRRLEYKTITMYNWMFVLDGIPLHDSLGHTDRFNSCIKHARIKDNYSVQLDVPTM